MRARGAAWCAMLAFVGEAACLRAAAFECTAADDCADAGTAGRCEPTGFCSFPDPSCPSEHRYGDHAGAGLGGTCVPPNDDTSTGLTVGDDDDSSTSATTPPPTTSQGDTTPLTDGTDSSGALTLTGDASTDTTGGTTTTPPDTSTTTGPVDPVCPSFADDFEDGVFDASWSFMDGAYVTEQGGELVFELTPELDPIFPGVLLHDRDLASGEVRIHVGQAPGSELARLYLAVAVDPAFSDVLYIMLDGDVVRMQREQAGVFSDYAEVPFDARAHAWLQIRGEDDGVHFEASADGATFDTLVTTAAAFPLLGTTVIVAATNSAVLPAAAFVSIADFEICTGA